MKKSNHTFLFRILLPFLFICWAAISVSYIKAPDPATMGLSSTQVSKKTFGRSDIYDSLHLETLGLTRAAFTQGISGLEQLTATGDIEDSSILSIADFSLPSSKKRLFVIDVNTCKLIYNTYVSHGRNSGREMATQFSNEPNSYESSLGFYVTGDTYIGHHGYSLKLIGKEEGINDNAFARGIVIHSASYVGDRIAASNGCVGRSEGCPAIPVKWHKNLIEKIKHGTCLFLYSADKFYAAHSKMRFWTVS